MDENRDELAEEAATEALETATDTVGQTEGDTPQDARETDGGTAAEGAAEATEQADGAGKAAWSPRRRAVAAIVAAALLALAGGAAVTASQASAPAKAEAEAQAKRKTKESAKTAKATVKVTADGLTEDSSAVITHWTGTAGEAEGVEFYHATAAADAPSGTDEVEVATGSWQVEVLASFNADGSLNAAAAAEEVKASSGAAAVERAAETVPADQVTQEQIDEALDAINAAVSKGDGTLTGEAGAAVVEKAAGNAVKNPNADAASVEQKRDEGASAATDAKPQETAPAKQETASGSGNGTASNSTSKSDTKQQASQKTDSGKGSSGSGGTSQAGGSAKKECSHDWVAQTTTKWVQDSAAWDEQVCTQAAWEEQVCTGSYFHFKYDGYNAYTLADANVHGDMLLDRGVTDAYEVIDIYTTVHHDAVYTTVHHDATGHNETVTTGYKCSKCGATK